MYPVTATNTTAVLYASGAKLRPFDASALVATAAGSLSTSAPMPPPTSPDVSDDGDNITTAALYASGVESRPLATPSLLARQPI